MSDTAVAGQGGQVESRSGAFGAGVMSHGLASQSAAEMQARYAHALGAGYLRAGVEQMTSNVPSALSLGVSPGSQRTGVWQGHRWLLAPGNGRSEQTRQAAPVIEEDV
jgi:hypothetical protein